MRKGEKRMAPTSELNGQVCTETPVCGSYWNKFNLPKEIKDALEEAETLGARRTKKRFSTAIRGEVCDNDLLSLPIDVARIFDRLNDFWSGFAVDLRSLQALRDENEELRVALKYVKPLEDQKTSECLCGCEDDKLLHVESRLDCGAAVSEPPPKGDNEVVLDSLLEHVNMLIESTLDPVHVHLLNGVRNDFIMRADEGLKKYGTKLRTFNGRSALMDAYQEALDLVMYLRQEIEERKTLSRGET